MSKEADVYTISAIELFSYAAIVTLAASFLSTGIGAMIREAHARRICDDCTGLIAELEKGKTLNGVYSTNAAALVKGNTILHRKYFVYYGQSSTNGIDWSADEIARANLSVFVTTNRFQLVVPIEKMSPISFSSFYVFSYTAENPIWTKTKLHWFLGGAFIDEPKR